MESECIYLAAVVLLEETSRSQMLSDAGVIVGTAAFETVAFVTHFRLPPAAPRRKIGWVERLSFDNLTSNRLSCMRYALRLRRHSSSSIS